MENKAIGLFDEAVRKLQDANTELCRPEEDVVSFLVCKNSQYAIENFLKGFLLSKGIDPQEYDNINDLYEQCVAINPKFKQLDLSGFTCKSHKTDSRSCSGAEKVSKCYEIAGNLDLFLRKEKLLN
ncbi:HEPN domain-containing protein [Salinimicrobium flavum]|uniref:HEPN domain-containing protein n=1 Tax=Salinimicrobium flavum TaxID=1737065 RepID=A0ABW5IUX6_9FLAO